MFLAPALCFRGQVLVMFPLQDVHRLFRCRAAFQRWDPRRAADREKTGKQDRGEHERHSGNRGDENGFKQVRAKRFPGP